MNNPVLTISGYLTTKDLENRYRKSARTLHRWTTREINPMPKPRHAPSGSTNLWAAEDIDEWEKTWLVH